MCEENILLKKERDGFNIQCNNNIKECLHLRQEMDKLEKTNDNLVEALSTLRKERDKLQDMFVIRVGVMGLRIMISM